MSHPVQAELRDRRGSGVARYLGFDVEPAGPVEPGAKLVLRHVFRPERAFDRELWVFVHGEVEGGQRIVVADHLPRRATSTWRPGELVEDRHAIAIPSDVVGSRLLLYGGLFAGEERATVVAAPGVSDGEDRIRLGSIPIRGGASDLPEVVVPRARGPIAADGRLDEASWATAPILGLSDSMGRGGAPRFPTKLRLLYDDEALYVAFEAVDRDITCPYARRDDPIYEHEAVELFLMPRRAAPELGPYVELQASPRGVIFDAAFTARRQGMDKSFDAGQTVGTTVDGTLDGPPDEDRGWVSEWRVPWAGVRGAAGAPRPGEEWRMNAFRIEKLRAGGRTEAEYTAWSPPRVGDFHAVDRFGRVRFGEAQ